MNAKHALGVIATLLFTGCATVPDVTVRYPKVTWQARASVIVTVGCNAAGDDLRYARMAAISPSYSRDLGAEPLEFRVRDLERKAADIDFSASFTDDGRLRGINHSSTGQGEAVFRSIASLDSALTLAGISTLTFSNGMNQPRRTPIQELCADVLRWGDGKPVSLTFTATLRPEHLGGEPISLKASTDSEQMANSLSRFLPVYEAQVSIDTNSKMPQSIQSDEDTERFVPLHLQETIRIVTTIKETRTDPAGTKVLAAPGFLAPSASIYAVHIPKPALFGRQGFSIGLGDAGNVTSISFGQSSGTSPSLNAAVSAIGMSTESAETAAMKAEADLIAAQQRLVACRTRPEACK